MAKLEGIVPPNYNAIEITGSLDNVENDFNALIEAMTTKVSSPSLYLESYARMIARDEPLMRLLNSRIKSIRALLNDEMRSAPLGKDEVSTLTDFCLIHDEFVDRYYPSAEQISYPSDELDAEKTAGNLQAFHAQISAAHEDAGDAIDESVFELEAHLKSKTYELTKMVAMRGDERKIEQKARESYYDSLRVWRGFAVVMHKITNRVKTEAIINPIRTTYTLLSLGETVWKYVGEFL